MHWLWTNKEWLFSGVGVAVIGPLLYTLFRLRTHTAGSSDISASRNSAVFGSPVAHGSNISQTINIGIAGTNSPSPHSVTSPAYEERPTPDEIEEQLLSLPIYQRPAARKSYLGLKVSWRVTLHDMSELSETERAVWKIDATHDVTFSPAHGRSIRSYVKIERFPRLKISREGTPVRISGSIWYVSESGDVRLQDVQIDFLDDGDPVPERDIFSPDDERTLRKLGI